MSEQPKPNLAEVCEHGTLKRRCDSCWAAKLEAENTAKDAELTQLREDRSWLTEQWQRHRKALNAIAWGEYDNVAFCRRLAQDELAIGVKAANDRAAATVKATDASGALGRANGIEQ